MTLRPLLALALLASSLVVGVAARAAPVPPATNAASSSPGRCAALVAGEAWVRLLPPGTANTAAFFRLKNTGAADVVVTGATSPIAKRAGVHGMTMKDGVMRMFDVERVVVPAGGEVAFAPGGLHVMLFEQTSPRAGDAVPLTLRCDDGSTVTLTATAQERAPTPPPAATPPKAATTTAPPAATPPKAATTTTAP